MTSTFPSSPSIVNFLTPHNTDSLVVSSRVFLGFPVAVDSLAFRLPSGWHPAMSMPVNKKSVRITLLDSGLSPPIFIVVSFTKPAWEPHQMNYAEVKLVDNGLVKGIDNEDSAVVQVDYVFWKRFDIFSGVWNFRYCSGLNDWTFCDTVAEIGK